MGRVRVFRMPDRPDRGDTTYDVFETDMGWVAIVGGYHGVVRASLPEASPSSALDAVQPEIGVAVHTPEQHIDSRVLITAFCAGEPVDLADIPIDTRDVSPFLKKAWEACRWIPSGQTPAIDGLRNRQGTRGLRGVPDRRWRATNSPCLCLATGS